MIENSSRIDINVNNSSYIDLNIGKVLNCVKNRIEAKWFCLQNSKIFLNFKNFIFQIFHHMIMNIFCNLVIQLKR